MSTRYELTGCPVCTSRGSELLADETDIRGEVETLWSHHTGDGDVAPPITELADRLAFTLPPALAVVRCLECGLLYRNPAERFVHQRYAEEARSDEVLEQLRTAQIPAFAPLLTRLHALNGGPGRGLEVGSYAGAFLDAAAAAGWHFTGVDVNAGSVAYLRRRGHRMIHGEIENVPAEPVLDVVAFWNCFDQLPDPAAAAGAARTRLRAGGIIALRVPNGDYYASLRRHLDGALRGAAAALLARHNFLGFPYRYGYTPGSLERLLNANGFTHIEVERARVLPTADGDGLGAERLLDAAEVALRPLVGAPWLEVYARRAR